MSLQEARQANLDTKSQLNEGLNPKQNSRRKNMQSQHEQLFNDYALLWLEERQRIVKARTYQQDHNRLHKDVIPNFQDIVLKKVTFDDCKYMADRIEARKRVDGSPPREVTRRTIDLVRNILKRARMEKLIDTNPADDLKELYPKGKTQHMKHVELSELPKLLIDIEGYHGHAQTRLAMKFLSYSFCRTIELRMMKWEHIDFSNELWRVDIDNLKIARRHVVPLSRQMLTVLNEMKEITGNYAFVFYNTGTHQPYNLSKLLMYIVNCTKPQKRAVYLNDINGDKKMWEKDDELINYRKRTQESIWESIKSNAEVGGELGKDIGGALFGKPGEVLGEVVGNIGGAIWGAITSIF